MEVLYKSTRGAGEAVTASQAIITGSRPTTVDCLCRMAIPKLTCSNESSLAGMTPIRRPHMR